MTQKQELQKARAYFKFILTGLIKPVNMKYLSEKEKTEWELIKAHRESLLKEFDNTSKEFGLNVSEYKCWCGKEGKHTPNYDTSHYHIKIAKVCKKHIDL